MLTYTTIQHAFRKANGLSMNEYTLCDMIYHLSTKPSSSVPGWCYMSKQSMGEELGLTKQAVLSMLDRLCKAGFLIKNQETKFYQTTEKWFKVYELDSGKETLPSVKKLYPTGKETLPDTGKETLPNNNTIDNNKIKSGDEAPIFESLIVKSFEIFSKAGLSGVFFQKMKSLYGLTDVEVSRLFNSWKKEHEATGTIFKTPEHLKNSFNKWIKNSTSGAKKAIMPVPERVRGGNLIGGG